MKPLQLLAQELVCSDEADLHRIRKMSESDFAILLALFAAESFQLAEDVKAFRREGLL